MPIMSADDIVIDAEERMEKAIDVLKKALAGIRTGRANPGLVDSIKVDVYGSPTPIKQIATVGAPEPQQIVIRPYDPSTIKDIEKAIIAGDLGLAPQNDGRVVRLNIPPLSTEVRKKMVARIKELSEEAKIAIRNIRRDGNKATDQAEKDKLISEDQRDDLKNEVQELTKKFEAKVAEMAKARESEVMED
jgi:ribosome recycling factor